MRVEECFGIPPFSLFYFYGEFAGWAGVLCCLGGLVTSGIFAVCRNPICVAFWFVLPGQLLLFANPIALVGLAGAPWR